jgi:hypothetical protein
MVILDKDADDKKWLFTVYKGEKREQCSHFAIT